MKERLNLSDLLQLLQSKDLGYVDEYLNKRGWLLHSTNVKEKPDNNSYNNDGEGIALDHKIVTWSFDRNTSTDLAKGWFYFHLCPTYDNAISYTIADGEQLDRLKNELTNDGSERIYPTDAIERCLESVYRNSLYEVTFRKQLRKQSESGADIHYNFFIYNYKQVEELKAELSDTPISPLGPDRHQSVTYNLSGRSIVGDFPLPAYNSQNQGIVVIEVAVDQDGKVTSARAIGKGATTQDSKLWKAAEEAAMKARFNVKKDAPISQIGTITYVFRLN